MRSPLWMRSTVESNAQFVRIQSLPASLSHSPIRGGLPSYTGCSAASKSADRGSGRSRLPGARQSAHTPPIRRFSSWDVHISYSTLALSVRESIVGNTPTVTPLLCLTRATTTCLSPGAESLMKKIRSRVRPPELPTRIRVRVHVRHRLPRILTRRPDAPVARTRSSRHRSSS